MSDAMNVDYDGLIPNNVGLADDLRVRKALETWHPGYIEWWKSMGPEGFQDSPVYLRLCGGAGKARQVSRRGRTARAPTPVSHPGSTGVTF